MLSVGDRFGIKPIAGNSSLPQAEEAMPSVRARKIRYRAITVS